MRILIFGGTLLVSRAVAADAVRRGHDVVCAARGESGQVPDGARLVQIDRDEPSTLDVLADGRYDAVVDTSIMSHRWTSEALEKLADRAEHWTFVSSISVYADHTTLGQSTDAPVLEPRPVHATLADRGFDRDLYGAVKVASENTVLAAFPNAHVLRAGLVTGPGDHTDRFGYWPMRFARGGQVVVPDDPRLPSQYIDVRDLAAWIVDCAEQRRGGVFDTITPHVPIAEQLAGIAEAVGFDGELVPIAPDKLTAAGVEIWGGPGSLPFWLTPDMYGLAAHDAQPALDAGLRSRSLADAALGALEYERELGLDRERKAGLAAKQEADLIADLA